MSLPAPPNVDLSVGSPSPAAPESERRWQTLAWGALGGALVGLLLLTIGIEALGRARREALQPRLPGGVGLTAVGTPNIPGDPEGLAEAPPEGFYAPYLRGQYEFRAGNAERALEQFRLALLVEPKAARPRIAAIFPALILNQDATAWRFAQEIPSLLALPHDSGRATTDHTKPESASSSPLLKLPPDPLGVDTFIRLAAVDLWARRPAGMNDDDPLPLPPPPVDSPHPARTAHRSRADHGATQGGEVGSDTLNDREARILALLPWRAALAARSEDDEALLRLYGEAASLETAPEYIRFRLARLYDQRGLHTEALAVLHDLWGDFPEDPAAAWASVAPWVADDAALLPRLIIQSVAERLPDEVSADLLALRLALATDRAEEAAALAQRLAEGANALTWLDIGNAYFDMGRHREALMAWDAAAHHPDAAEQLPSAAVERAAHTLDRVQALLELGQSAEATQELAHLPQLGGDNALRRRVLRLVAQRQSGASAPARTALFALVDEAGINAEDIHTITATWGIAATPPWPSSTDGDNPKDPQRGNASVPSPSSNTTIATFREILADVAEIYRRAVIRFPDDIPLALGYARALDDTGRPREALAVAQDLIDRGKAVPEAANFMGFLLSRIARDDAELQRAEGYVRWALSQVPDEVAFLDSLAWVLFRQGRPRRALPFIHLAARIDPAVPEIGLHRACILWALDRRPEAETQARRSIAELRRGPWHPYAEELLTTWRNCRHMQR